MISVPESIFWQKCQVWHVNWAIVSTLDGEWANTNGDGSLDPHVELETLSKDTFKVAEHFYSHKDSMFDYAIFEIWMDIVQSMW